MKNRMVSFSGENLLEVTKKADYFLRNTDGVLDHVLYQHPAVGDVLDAGDLFSIVVVFTPGEEKNEERKEGQKKDRKSDA